MEKSPICEEIVHEVIPDGFYGHTTREIDCGSLGIHDVPVYCPECQMHHIRLNAKRRAEHVKELRRAAL